MLGKRFDMFESLKVTVQSIYIWVLNTAIHISAFLNIIFTLVCVLLSCTEGG